MIELESQIYQVQDTLDRANQTNANMRGFRDHELSWNSEERSLHRFHVFDDGPILMQAPPVTMYVCKECEERREKENAEMDQYQHGWC